MNAADVPESVAIDRQASITTHAIQRIVARLRIQVNRWDPRPCPDDWQPPVSAIVSRWQS